MSTWYYLVCDKHRVSTDIILGRWFPDRWWTDHEESLAAFGRDHADCKPAPRLVSEHAAEAGDYERPYDRDDES
jgi:endonuclease III